MFKNIPAKNVITNNEQNFVNQTQVSNINKIGDIEQNVTNLQNAVGDTNNQLSQIEQQIQSVVSSALTTIELVNERLPIELGSFTLSKTPLNNALVHNMYMIVNNLSDGTLLIHQEVIGDFAIVDNKIDLGTSFYNGYDAMVSYIVVGGAQ
jgi:hypothetical protein